MATSFFICLIMAGPLNKKCTFFAPVPQSKREFIENNSKDYKKQKETIKYM